MTAADSKPLDLDAAAAYLTELAQRDLDTDSPLPPAMLALVEEWKRQRDEIARLRDALADADAYLRRALVATVDMTDLKEAREDLHAGRNAARAALAGGEVGQ